MPLLSKGRWWTHRELSETQWTQAHVEWRGLSGEDRARAEAKDWADRLAKKGARL